MEMAEYKRDYALLSDKNINYLWFYSTQAVWK
jgi:hypothetical protein